MCGLFGYAAPTGPKRGRRVAERLSALGALAEYRGPDSWGLATFGPSGWHLTRQLGSFSSARLRDRAACNQASFIMGHTRYATQGAVTVANASPQVRGSVLGAHNGDVDRDSVPLVDDDPSMGTDSAVLLEGLSLAVREGEVDIDLACTVLQSVRGRVACSWAVLDRKSAPYLWLARGAHSPLSLGIDRDGGVWWASEAWWLDELCRSVTTLPEGSIVQLSRRGGASYRQVASFVPQPRPEDIARLSHLRYAPTH